MAYIPQDAKWYLAEIIQEIKIGDESLSRVHINWVLVYADSPEEAYERANQLGKEGELAYINAKNRPVDIIFRGLHDLHVIHDKLEHGCELIYEEKQGLSSADIERLAKTKGELGVFRARPTTVDQDFMPLDLLEQINDLDRGKAKPSLTSD